MHAPEVPHVFRTLPEHQGCFLLDIPDTLRTCITFGIFISDISDIQHLIYLCTFSWCSGSSAFLFGHLPEHRGYFLRILRTLPGHVLHLAYLFRIFRTLSTSFICVCSGSSAYFRTFTRAPGLFFSGYSGHSQDMYYIWYIYFEYFGHSAAYLFVHSLLMLRTVRIFFRTFTRAPGLFSSDTPDTPRTCITLGIFISDISDIKHFICLCMLRKFRIFLGHLPEHQGCFLSDIPDTLRTCITFGIFISDISDIQQLIYLCTFSWCSGSSAFFFGHLPEHRGYFLWILQTLPGHILHLAYLFRIFRTLSTSFICACSGSSAFF